MFEIFWLVPKNSTPKEVLFKADVKDSIVVKKQSKIEKICEFTTLNLENWRIYFHQKKYFVKPTMYLVNTLAKQ